MMWRRVLDSPALVPADWLCSSVFGLGLSPQSSSDVGPHQTVRQASARCATGPANRKVLSGRAPGRLLRGRLRQRLVFNLDLWGLKPGSSTGRK